MKFFFTITFFLFIVKLSSGQFNTMFNDTLRPFSIGTYHNRTICADDSFYYVGGVFYNGIISVNQYYILKLDKNGNVLRKNSYFDTMYDYHADPYNSMILNKNEIISCLITDNVSQYEIKSKVISVNRYTLDTIWTKHYPHPDTASIMSSADEYSVLTVIKATPDHGYILAGNYMAAGNERSYLMKIDSVGNTLWTKKYLTYSGLTNLIVSQDSGFFIPCNNNNLLKLIKLDKHGVFEWEIGFNSNSNPSYPVSLSILNNNSIIITSVYWYDLNNELRGLTATKINSINKSISWEKNFILFKNLRCITLYQAMGVETLSDGSIIVSGTLAKTGADLKGFIFKLNSDGDSLWTKTYDFGSPTYDDCQLNDLVVCDDGGFMGVGFFWSHLANVNDAAWMFKTDANGVVGWEETKPQAKLIEAKVYPNPARDYITFEFQQGIEQDAALRLYNALGQMVLEEKLNKGMQQIQISLKAMQSGIYLLQVRDRNGVVSTKKFVKE